jgi:hypothetical protein
MRRGCHLEQHSFLVIQLHPLLIGLAGKPELGGGYYA